MRLLTKGWAILAALLVGGVVAVPAPALASKAAAPKQPGTLHVYDQGKLFTEGGIDIMPEVLVTGGGGSLEGLAATLMQTVRNGGFGGGSSSATPATGTELVVVDEAPEPPSTEVPAPV